MKEFYQYQSFSEGINKLAHKKIDIDNKNLYLEIINYMVHYYDNLDKNNTQDIEFMFKYLGSFFGPFLKEVFEFCELEENIKQKKEDLKDKITPDIMTLHLKNSLLIHNNQCKNNKIKVPYDLNNICNFYGYKKDTKEYKVFYLMLKNPETFTKAINLYAISFL
jgi:hypothetical protein